MKFLICLLIISLVAADQPIIIKIKHDPKTNQSNVMLYFNYSIKHNTTFDAGRISDLFTLQAMLAKSQILIEYSDPKKFKPLMLNLAKKGLTSMELRIEN